MNEVTAADVRLLSSVKSWAAARAERLTEKHAMEVHRCEWMERADPDPETGGGVPPCFAAGMATDEWCPACQARDPHFQRMVNLKSIERRYFRDLCSLLARREKRSALASPAPPKEPNE